MLVTAGWSTGGSGRSENKGRMLKLLSILTVNVIVVVVVDLPLLRVAVEGSDNPISLEKPCQASLPPDQQGHHSLGRHPEVQYIA